MEPKGLSEQLDAPHFRAYHVRAGLWLAALISGAFACTAAVGGDAPDEYEGLPAGPGQDEVYAICSGCHSVKLVVQQGLSRESWEETLDWMVDEQGMAEMDAETRTIVLDYLATQLGTDHRPARVQGLR